MVALGPLTETVLNALADEVSREYHQMRLKKLPIDMRAIQRHVLKQAGINNPTREMFQELGRVLGNRAAARKAAQKRRGLPPLRPQAIRSDRKKKTERFRETFWPM